MRGVERAQRLRRCVRVRDASVVAQRPAIETARTPAHAVQGVVVGVVNDGADVIRDSEYLTSLHRLGIDLIHDRPAVRPVLGHGHPDTPTVVIESAGMIHRAFPQLDIGDELPRHVDLEQVADSFAGIPIVAIDWVRQAPGRYLDLDGRHKQRVSDLHHALGMVGRERDRHGRHELPG